MARGRPHGRSKSDHRVCQAARYERAAELRREGKHQQVARIATVNAECHVEDTAPHRRRSQKSREVKTMSWAGRVSAQGRSCKGSGSAKRKAITPLEQLLGKATERDPHFLHCHQCGATAEFGLLGGKQRGGVKFFCRGHLPSNGCFRVDRDRADWAEDQELRSLRAHERRLAEELRNLGGTSFAAERAPGKRSTYPIALSHSRSSGGLRPMNRALIAMLLTIGGIESNPGPLSNEEEIDACRRSWQEAKPRIGALLLAYLAKEKVHFADWEELSPKERLAEVNKYKKAYETENVGEKWALGWDNFLVKAGAAVKGHTDADAGPSQDVVMQDAAREGHRRRSNEELWDDRVAEEVRKVLEDAFVSPEGNGRPQLDIKMPSPNNPLARPDASAVYFRDSPSLLLTNLPERGGDGRTKAPDLLEENERLHASGRGQHQVQTRVTTLVGPSGAGKTRTALEALCHKYGFYLSFSTEKEPGTRVLQKAIQRLEERFVNQYEAILGDPPRLQQFRRHRLLDMSKFISRMLLAYALGLLEYLKQHGDQASPKGFLFFQLIGIVGQEDWLLKTWVCLLGLSREAVEQKLQRTMEELQRWTDQSFFNVFLDEAQVGTRELDGYFPSSDKTQGRPLLNGWLRSLGDTVFAPFHFNLTGTGLSLRHAQQLETAIGEMGAAQLATFTDFTRFTMDDALEYAQEYLLSPPEGIRGHILVGRPRFAAQLVQAVLLWGKSWEAALEFVEELHTTQNVPTSLLKGLYEKKEKLSGDLFGLLVEELQLLVLAYYIVGRGVSTDKGNVDMIEVGVCHLDQLGRPGECTMVTLVEPLAAIAVTNFLAKEVHWRLENQGLNMIRTSPSDSAMGALFERIVPRAQQRFVTRDCLADHPLLRGIGGLPDCFYGPARMECLNGQGDTSYHLTLDDFPRVEAWRQGRGLLQYLQEPAGASSFFPEEEAGPDKASFLRIGDERWITFLQAKCRKKVPSKAHALGTLTIGTMYKGDLGPVAEAKRHQLKAVLKQHGVTGILRVLLAYPATVKGIHSYAKSQLRRSKRLSLQEEDEFAVVQVCISKLNAQHYLTDAERNHLDCLKDV